MGSRHTVRAIAGMVSLTLLAGCAGSPLGDSVERSLEADPQLEESAPFGAGDSATTDSQSTDQLPPDEVATDETRPDTASEDVAAAGSISDAIAAAPEPGDTDFIGPMPQPLTPSDESRETASSANASEESTTASSLQGVPTDLQTYIRDLQALDLLTLTAAADEDEVKTADSGDAPYSQPITRREYARWLFDSYNTIYADEPGERLRSGIGSDEPAFQDVSPDSTNFGAIQGLAEAGIIPSAFTGNSTDVNFRPDAPLTREDLILWKVPLDLQAPLPATSPDAVTEIWGFQDTADIDPLALRAIAADYQLGDFANFSRAFGFTTLFRPDKAVSRAEAAAVIWRFGNSTEGQSAASIQSGDASDRP